MMKDIKKLQFKLDRLVDSLFVGNYKTAFKGRGIEFSDFKEYDMSDDAKDIDFLASSRANTLLVKKFEEERELGVYFLLDISKSMDFSYKGEKSKLDTLTEIFYILALSAQKSGDKIGALIFDENGYEFIKARRGYNNIRQIVDKINSRELRIVEGYDYNEALKYFNSLPIKNSLVFLLTDKMSDFLDINLKISSIKNDFIYINIFDKFENHLSDEKGIIRLKNNKKTFFINLYNKKRIFNYRKLRAKKILDLNKKIHRYRGDYLVFDETSNLFSNLFVFFKNR